MTVVFDSFSAKARASIEQGKEEARALRSHRIGTEHLLLGVLHDRSDMSCRILEEFGLTGSSVRRSIEAMGPDPAEDGAHVSFSVRARSALEAGRLMAILMGASGVGNEHLLLGLTGEIGGGAARVMSDLCPYPGKIRAELLSAMAAEDARSAGNLATNARLAAVEERLHAVEKVLKGREGLKS